MSDGNVDMSNNDDFIRLKLVPSDQLLSIAVVNFILFVTIWAALKEGYEQTPEIPGWVIALAVGMIGAPGLLATSDSWLPGLVRIIKGRDSENGQAPVLSERLLKPAVFICTGVTLLVLWQVTDCTDGVAGPFVPFLTAPAVFSPFVARNPLPIGGLSIAVVACIVILQTPPQESLLTPADWTFKLVAAMMIAIAAALTIVRLLVERGGPITGPETSG
jgi:hypothetical protein